MNDENELLEPLATEAGQQAIARAINNLGSLENAVRAERAAATATQKADEARNSAEDASDYATEARNWATKTDGYVDQETITIPPEQEGDEPTTETIDLYSARYYAALAQDIYNNLSFDTEPTENSTALVSSGAIYTALNGKADKSDTYTKTEVDTALSNVQGQLTFDNVPTANSDNPVKSSGIKTALDGKQDTLTFDSTPTANSNNPVTSGGVYTALQNVNIDIDDEITEDSDNPVTSAAIYEALQNLPSGSEISGDVIYDVLSLPDYVNSQDLLSGYTPTTTIREVTVSKDGVARIWGDCATTGYTILIYVNGVMVGRYSSYARITIDKHIIVKSGDIIGIKVDGGSNWRNVSITLYPFVPKNLSEQMYSNVLYFNDGGVQTGTITLNDDFDNYDFIEFVCGYSKATYSGSRDDIGSYIASVEQIKDRNHFYVSDWGERTITFNFDLTNRKQVILGHSGNADVFKIIGHKMAKGGYSGIVSDARMTVKSGTVTTTNAITDSTPFTTTITFDSPMPDTNYKVIATGGGRSTGSSGLLITASEKTVNGFKINAVKGANWNINSGACIDWIAIRPNSYTREGMVEDVLFSNASGVNSGTINLSGNISDYDLIEVIHKWGSNTNDASTYDLFSTSQLINNGGALLCGYGTRYTAIRYATDSSLSIYISENDSITKITGIKFGRYVSGVAVDTTITSSGTGVPSTNAVYQALQNISSGGGGGGSITIDSTPTENSNNAVSSGGVYDAIKYGLPVAFEDLVPSDYKLQTADEWIYSQNGRSYYKKNNGIAAGAIINTNRNTHAILVSDNSNSVVTYSSYNTSDDSDVYTLTFNGKTYYYSVSEYGWDRGSMDVPQSDASVKTLTTFQSDQVAAQYIIENVLTEDKTLNDYNITDAYTKTEVDTLIQNAGGGSSITVDSTITQGGTNPVEGGAIYTALDNKADKSTTYTKTEVDTALGSKQGTLTFDTTPTQNSSNPVTSGGVYTALQNLPTGTGDVTTNTDQNITGTKTFVGSKKVGFKQSAANDKLGFTLYGNTGTERGYLEFNPQNTIDGVAGLMTLGNYATSAGALTHVGFRRYSNISGASGAYNLLTPLIADAKSPFSLTTTYQNFYLPLGFTNGTTTVRTAKTGVVDLSPLLASLEARIAALEGN